MNEDPLAADEDFFQYCLIHSETELALFSARDCRRLFRLAREHFPVCRLPDAAFRSMDRWLVRELVNKARRHIRIAEESSLPHPR